MTRLSIPLTLFLVAVSAVGPMALNGVLPAATTIMVDLSTRFEVVQMVLTVFLLASLASQLVMGPAADRFGRRPIMLLNLGIFFVGSLMCGSAQTIEWLLAGRFVQGVGGAVCVFLPRTVVRDIYAQDKAASVIGYITTAMMVAPLFAPALGGWITDQYSWRFMYFGLAMLSILLFALAYRYQSETLVSGTSTESQPLDKWSFFSSSAILLRDRGFRACAQMQAGTVGVYYSFLAGAPYVAMESRGMSASAYGVWFSMVAVGYLSGNLVAGKFSESLGVYRMVVLGAIPFVVGVVLFWLGMFIQHPLALFLPMQIVAFSNGMSLPSMFSIAMTVRQDLAASASGLAGSLQTAMGVCLTVLVGFLLPFSDIWLFLIITASMIFSLLGLMSTLWLQRKMQLSVAHH